MRKIIASLAAGGLLVGAAFAASVISDNGAASAQTTDDTTSDAPLLDAGTVWDDFLQSLVDEGIITADQVDPIKNALVDRMGEFRGFRGGPRGHGHDGFYLQGLLEDGVIDADELAALPEGNPLTDPDGPFADALADGQITQEEFDAVEAERRAVHDLIESFLEDGVITSDELAQLPSDHPLVTSDAAADGEITADELPQREFHGRHGKGGFGRGFGPGFDDDTTTDTTASETSF